MPQDAAVVPTPKPLQFPFTRDGFNHELLKRECLVCLVKRSKPAHWHFEVVKLKIKPSQEFNGVLYPLREAYPSNEEWGTHGFTYHASQLDQAKEQYLSLQKATLEAEVG